MARHHDVVQVSVNHRLNILGFFDLSEVGGAAYADSVNVGMTDLVAALRWWRQYRQFRRRSRQSDDLRPVGRRLEGDHAHGHAFGGGAVPSRFGAIGRGRQSPQRRAIARVRQTSDGRTGAGRQGHRGLAENGMGQAQCGRQCCRGQDQSDSAANARPRSAGCGNTARRLRANRRRADHHHALVLRCSSRNLEKRPHADWLGERGRQPHVFQTLRGTVARDALGRDRRCQGRRPDCRHEKGAPGKKHPYVVVRGKRFASAKPSYANGQAKVGTKRAPVFTYFFTWQSPILEDAGAWHTAELAFCFDNTKRCEQGTGNTQEAQALAKSMATAWATLRGPAIQVIPT